MPLLAAHGRHGQADHLAVVVGRHAQVAAADRFFDLLEGGLIEGPDEDLLRVGRADLGQLLERGGRAVVLDPQMIDQGGGGSAGAQAAQLVAIDADGFFHPFLGVQQDLVVSHDRSIG